MKHTFLNKSGVLIWLLLFMTFYAVAQSSLRKEDIIQTLKEFDNAMVQRNSEVLASIVSDNLTYGHSSGNIQNKDQFLDDALNGPFQFISIANEEQSLVVSKDTGIVRHILAADAKNNGSPTKIRIGVLMVFQKNDHGKILLLARQAYKL
ncbi:nuclear transport factor 2 family protein [Euzebyella saccharophila]|uniref:Nuclear transport factor 2 family protein n=1 Tax=Euzebyella saccharophila TaxID=679664 RepID=A0ABV8JK71_9FLAO|nr:nuclear transport factor 2 family protein [Euzebyella saccharophila]